MTIIGNRTTWTDDLNPNNFAAEVGAKSAPFPKMYPKRESFFGSNMGLESPLAGPVTSQSMGIKQSDIRSAIPITFPKLGHITRNNAIGLGIGAAVLTILVTLPLVDHREQGRKDAKLIAAMATDFLETLEPGKPKRMIL